MSAGWVEALERIKSRAQRVMDGQLECTAFSVADYDLQVSTPALPQARAAARVVEAAEAISERTARSRNYEKKTRTERLLKNFGSADEFDELTAALEAYRSTIEPVVAASGCEVRGAHRHGGQREYQYRRSLQPRSR